MGLEELDEAGVLFSDSEEPFFFHVKSHIGEFGLKNYQHLLLLEVIVVFLLSWRDCN